MILIVDDDAVNTRVWSHLLARLRRQSLAVTTGCAALEALTTQPVDLLVCAVVLPDADGLALIERARTCPHLSELPAIVCTGHADEATVRRALALGIADFVVKPIRADRLLIRLESVFRALPRRWESRGDTGRRLRITPLEVSELTMLAHAQLRELVTMLRIMLDVPAPSAAFTDTGSVPDWSAARVESSADGVAPALPSTAPDAAALGAAVRRVRDAALTVGALRCAQLIDRLWRPDPSSVMSTAELRPFLDALVVEDAAFAAMRRVTPSPPPPAGRQSGGPLGGTIATALRVA